MKAIHHTIEKKDISLAQWLAQTKELESGDLNEAIREYKRIALAYPKNEKAFNRLMILFRKLNQDKDELYWVNKAIQNFQERGDKKKHPPGSSIARLSKLISKSTGLTDKKGNPLHVSAPIEKWLRRKALITKRMNS